MHFEKETVISISWLISSLGWSNIHEGIMASNYMFVTMYGFKEFSMLLLCKEINDAAEKSPLLLKTNL